MTVEPSVVPGLLFLAGELVALAAIGYVIVRVALRESDDRVALAQGLVVGPAIWGVVVNLVMYALPGLAGAVPRAGYSCSRWPPSWYGAPRNRFARGCAQRRGFALATVALFCGRARLPPDCWAIMDDAAIRLGLPASIRAGRVSTRVALEPGNAQLHTTMAPPMLLTGCWPRRGVPDLAFVRGAARSIRLDDFASPWS